MHRIIFFIAIIVILFAFLLVVFGGVTGVKYKPISIIELFGEITSYQFSSEKTIDYFELLGDIYDGDYAFDETLPEELPDFIVTILGVVLKSVQGLAIFACLIWHIFLDFLRACVFAFSLLSSLLVPA